MIRAEVPLSANRESIPHENKPTPYSDFIWHLLTAHPVWHDQLVSGANYENPS
ncbi:MAG: hypothetical protein K0Q55_3059 [Verrucomicrobia bacterium]|jgi:hypothetical protein|nr:hypothetical protein [Verrucomicrobiota bacterium]